MTCWFSCCCNLLSACCPLTICSTEKQGSSSRCDPERTELVAGPIFEGYGARIAKNQFDITKETPGMATSLAMKDVSHIRDLARDSKARPSCTYPQDADRPSTRCTY